MKQERELLSRSIIGILVTQKRDLASPLISTLINNSILNLAPVPPLSPPPGKTKQNAQQKFEEMAKELPMMSSVDCEMRVKGLSYSVQRAKGSADDPTVGDSFLAVGKTLACLPLIKRCAWGQVGRTLAVALIVRYLDSRFEEGGGIRGIGRGVGGGLSFLMEALRPRVLACFITRTSDPGFPF